MDLGNGSPNNFILFPERTNATIASSFPVTPFNPLLMSYSAMYDYWNRPNEAVSKVLPLQMDGPASIRMVYLCQFLRAKSPGQLFIFCEEDSYAWWVFVHFFSLGSAALKVFWCYS
ncbi:hypothetical protein BDQ17DRAFT_1365725 [Cyathus striatus]|nr:hypothetical protein BDQ17DRAFT_1365725 [Cyathus striatus]